MKTIEEVRQFIEKFIDRDYIVSMGLHDVSITEDDHILNAKGIFADPQFSADGKFILFRRNTAENKHKAMGKRHLFA